ncbi:hypothetical protein [Desertibacillus haloalkaliphilus]|uniref:hypothetical protein n=1 Tax=Desertibacillus haloalkaliphilus TaxID=1328930 RepID=UPI001C25D045|nr:hypothetical protein [Desertibacillus haloalkaliphilus]MBU8908249.1 hypothetical protein [Desertibacillus haloalkaliphilus]
MSKTKIISARLPVQTLNKLDHLVNHFNENTIGDVSRKSILDAAIHDLYEKYLGEQTPSQQVSATQSVEIDKEEFDEVETNHLSPKQVEETNEDNERNVKVAHKIESDDSHHEQVNQSNIEHVATNEPEEKDNDSDSHDPFDDPDLSDFFIKESQQN